jgi:septum formation protein
MSSPAQPATLVLASASPRRSALLAQLGIAFVVQPAELDETPVPQERAEPYVLRLAQAKAAAVARGRPGALVLAADTTVEVDGAILGKPADASEGAAMLRALSGRAHRVHTGIALAGRFTDSRVITTAVRFRALREEEIAWYVGTGEGTDKAGGYGSQGKAALFITALEGSATNVIGLPLAESCELLRAAGFPLPWSAP